MRVKLKRCDGECAKETVIWKQFEGKRYCRNCWNKIKPTAPISRGNAPLKQRIPISKHSSKRAKQELAYSILRKAFLQAHPMCQAHVDHDCLGRAGEVHHKSGRIGDLLCDDTKFLAVCSRCHFYIENNRLEAIDKGWSLPRLTNEE